jgi:DNA-binding NtrC family response regulator
LLDYYNCKILIVDDEDNIRDVIKDILKPLDAEILEAENGAKAIELLKKHKINTVILDYKMPEVNGLEVLKYISENSPKTTSIMVTAFAERSDVITAIEYGLFDFIEKPFAPTILFTRVKNALDNAMNKELITKIVKDLVYQYCEITDPEIFESMSIEEQNKALKTALKLFEIREIKKEIKKLFRKN